MVSYIRSEDRTRADRDANQLALGYIHLLSKRTSLYTSYAHVNVNDVQKLNVGIRHSF
jgi:predicted porin